METITVDFQKYKESILSKPYGITIIFGQKGSGKTALNTVFALWEMAVKQRYNCVISEIESLQQEKGRNFSFPPQSHCVYTSPLYCVKDNWKYGTKRNVTYSFDPYQFNIPNDRIIYEIFPPYSSFHIMEGQAFLNSRMSRYFPDETSRAYENERHPNFLMTIDCQRLGLIDLNVKEITDYFICPIVLEHEYNSVGAMIKTIFHCLVFTDLASAEAYSDKKDQTLGKLVDIVFEGGCIFNCYNSHSSKDLFYNTKQDFKYVSSDDTKNQTFLSAKNYYKKG